MIDRSKNYSWRYEKLSNRKYYLYKMSKTYYDEFFSNLWKNEDILSLINSYFYIHKNYTYSKIPSDYTLHSL